MSRRRWWRRLALLILTPWLVLVLSLLALRWLPPPVTAFMLQAEQRPVHYQWLDWEQIPPAAALAAIAAEDQRFPHHNGFDFNQISAALDDYQNGKPLRGASTISQQVCKNLFLWPGGGFLRKGLEAGCTAHLELLWPKRRILEVYLNVVEFAPGVYGVEAAARRFFAKPAQHLRRAECALMMSVLPSPKRLNLAAPTPYMRERSTWIQQQMRQLGDAYVAGL